MAGLTLFHVTTPTNAEEIFLFGFKGGWGDVGFGVYVYDDLLSAEDYAADGGWDGGLAQSVIIEISAEAAEIESVIPDPAWPNPEDYEHVMFRPMDDDERWRPQMRILEEDGPEQSP